MLSTTKTLRCRGHLAHHGMPTEGKSSSPDILASEYTLHPSAFKCRAGQDHRRGITCLMSSSVAPGKPTEMQVKGPEYSIPCNSFPMMPCSAHLHPCTPSGFGQGLGCSEKKPTSEQQGSSGVGFAGQPGRYQSSPSSWLWASPA